MSEASIALNRFGLGATPADRPPADPRGWLLDQLDRYDPAPAPIAAVPGSGQAASDIAEFRARQRELRDEDGDRTQQMEARRMAARGARGDYAAAVAARTNAALVTPAPFAERLVHFWANHFAVSADRLELNGLAGSLEFEAVRPHLLGTFADMLHAVERHPAMLLYLDQVQSTGPDSPAAQRAAGRPRQPGLNENLAREIMELHTLGVRTGYTQEDVTELARALTGWTVGGLGRGGRRNAEPGAFVFDPRRHQPGARTIMGQSYPEGGEAQGQAVLADLAAHPATARHLAIKLARHFAGDTPPEPMVARLEEAWLASGGDLPTVYRTIVASPEAWTATPAKFRNPWEWTLATHRALGIGEVQPGTLVGLMNQLGQPVWRPGQPVGYDDTAPSWAAPDALMRRVEAAERLAARTAEQDVGALAGMLFPGAVSPATQQAIARAESRAQALALLLVAPEMMRR